MVENQDVTEPAALALQSFKSGAYNTCISRLSELESLAPSNPRIIHNKALAEYYLSDLKATEKYCNALCQLTCQTFPSVNTNELKPARYLQLFNYAVLLYHSRYYHQCNLLLENLANSISSIKSKHLASMIILLLMEVYLCRRLPEKTSAIANTFREMLQSNAQFAKIYERLVYRTNLMLGKSNKPPAKIDSIEWLLLLAHHQYLRGEGMAAALTIGQYKTLNIEYNLKSQGEDVWASINNNLGVIHLSLNKPTLATKYFQQAVKEHFRVMESKDSNRLIVCRDRPTYVFNLGLALLRANKPEGAFECLVEAARHFPNNPRLWLRLAECCVKHTCTENSQKLTVKRIGSGPNAKLVIGRNSKDKYSVTSESFAIPTLSLEFAALCLRNAVTLLPAMDAPADFNKLQFQAAPSVPLNWKQRCALKNSVLTLYSFVLLQLNDPIAALKFANQLLNQTDTFVGNSQKALCHLYAAESLIGLDRINEAIEHLNPSMVHEIVTTLNPQMQDMIGVAIWSSAAVCHAVRGDLVTARKILMQINSARVLPLKMYLEMSTGNIENCHAMLRKFRTINL